MILPEERKKASISDPRFMILFGKQKCGKTTIISALDDCLMVDFERGTEFVDSMSVEVNTVEELAEVVNLLKEKSESKGGEPAYRYIALDTATEMEELVMPIAIKNYKATPMGKGFKGNDLRILPQGAGYWYIREAFKKVVKAFEPYCKTLILLGHVSDKQIERQGKEVWEMELDLTGKLKKIIGARADAIGYVYRNKNQTIISFKGGGDAIIESRPKHLSGREIVVAESDEENNMTFYWDRVFKD